MGEKILDVFYPPVCPFCGEILPAGPIRKKSGGICVSCRERLPAVKEPRCFRCGRPVKSREQEFCRDCARISYAYEQGRSLWLHIGPVPSAVYQMKFHNKRYYAKIFAREMAEQYEGWIREKGIKEIIPVPLHRARRRKRGFNQAELLGVELGRILDIPVGKKVVFRVRNTKPQKNLGAQKRQENLKGAFGVSPVWKAASNVLIVDDIYTTGSTIHRIASLLKKAGAKKVYFLTISIGQGL